MSETFAPPPLTTEIRPPMDAQELRQRSPLEGMEGKVPPGAEAAFHELQAAVEASRNNIELNTAYDAKRVVDEVGREHQASSVIATAEALDAAGYVTAKKLPEHVRARMDREARGRKPSRFNPWKGEGQIEETADQYRLAKTSSTYDSRVRSPIEDRGFAKRDVVTELASNFAEATAPGPDSDSYFYSVEGQEELTQAGLEGFDRQVTEKVMGILGVKPAAEGNQTPLSPAEVANGLKALAEEWRNSKATLSPEVLKKLEDRGILMSADKQREEMARVVAEAPEKFAEAAATEKKAMNMAKLIVGLSSGGGEVFNALFGDGEQLNFMSGRPSTGERFDDTRQPKSTGSRARANGAQAGGRDENKDVYQGADPSIVTDGPLAGRRLDESQMAEYKKIMNENPQIATGEGTSQDYRNLSKKYHPDKGDGANSDAFGVVSMIKEGGGFQAKSKAAPADKPQPAPAPAQAAPQPKPAPRAPTAPLELEAAPVELAEAEKPNVAPVVDLQAAAQRNAAIAAQESDTETAKAA